MIECGWELSAASITKSLPLIPIIVSILAYLIKTSDSQRPRNFVLLQGCVGRRAELRWLGCFCVMSFVDSICVRFIDEGAVIYGKQLSQRPCQPSLTITLSGKGNRLILRAGRTETINEIAPYDKIHQISFRRKDDGSFQVAASAGREILFTQIADNKFQHSTSFKLSDWISSIKVLENGLVASMTAHNIVALLELVETELVIREKLLCEENATLYCSHISGTSWNDLIFFGGTALGELVVWIKHESLPKILLRQFLHNGVIFSVDYNEPEGLLVGCHPSHLNATSHCCHVLFPPLTADIVR